MSISSEAYIVGEVWEDGRPWLQGDQFDGVMNYLFAEAAIAFSAGHRVRRETVEDRAYAPSPAIDGRAYAAKIDHLLRLYPWPIQLTQLNLLDSHDVTHHRTGPRRADADALRAQRRGLRRLALPRRPRMRGYPFTLG